MGYSYSVTCHSIKARDYAAEFLRSTPTWSQLLDELYPCHMEHVCVGDELDYGASILKVGWNCVVSGDAHLYMVSLLRFIALRVGRKCRFKEGTFHYWNYDNEATPIVGVGELGYKPMYRPWGKNNNPNPLLITSFFGKNIDRLKHREDTENMFQHWEKLVQDQLVECNERWKP